VGRVSRFSARLAEPRALLLDGATGTELQRRGVSTRLPLWSTWALLEAPDVVRQIHAEHHAVGAEVLTACTFRTHARTLAAAGLEGRAVELTRLAVQLAREAGGSATLVAGSLAPLEDCYEPGRVPSEPILDREHAAQAAALAAAGVDLILAETFGTIREATAATRAALATGLPVVSGLICGPDGALLSGETVAAAAAALLPLEPAALAINCTPAVTLAEPLAALLAVTGGRPVGAYGNIGYPAPDHGWVATRAQDPDAYAELARGWLDQGARLIGGCCGTTPAHIARLRRMLDDR
jgi:S-methylmethionine-dependent homocysteine/selenocysteine methylase